GREDADAGAGGDQGHRAGVGDAYRGGDHAGWQAPPVEEAGVGQRLAAAHRGGQGAAGGARAEGAVRRGGPGGGARVAGAGDAARQVAGGDQHGRARGRAQREIAAQDAEGGEGGGDEAAAPRAPPQPGPDHGSSNGSLMPSRAEPQEHVRSSGRAWTVSATRLRMRATLRAKNAMTSSWVTPSPASTPASRSVTSDSEV